MTLYNLFYKQENGKMVKFISDELIIYLNSVVLAYWAMDDGVLMVLLFIQKDLHYQKFIS